MTRHKRSRFDWAARMVGSTAAAVAVQRLTTVTLDGRTEGFIDVSYTRDGLTSEPTRVDLRRMQDAYDDARSSTGLDREVGLDREAGLGPEAGPTAEADRPETLTDRAARPLRRADS